MEERRIEIEVINTAKDYRSVSIILLKNKLIIVGILYFIIAIPILWLALFGAGANPSTANNRPIVLIMTFFVVLPTLILGSIFYNIRKQSKIIEKSLRPVKFIFTDSGLESIAESASAKAKWSAIHNVRELKNEFLFYPQKNIYYIIPKRSFESESQINEFRSLLSDSLGSKAKLGA